MNPVAVVSGVVTNVERSLLLRHAAGSLVVASLATALLLGWGTAAGFMAPPAAGDGMPVLRWPWFLACLVTYWLAAGAGMAYERYRQIRARALAGAQLQMAARGAAQPPRLRGFGRLNDVYDRDEALLFELAMPAAMSAARAEHV
jgi:hypothetical protein